MSKKNKIISLRVNEEIFDYIVKESDKLSLTKSDFIVSAILKKDTTINTNQKEKNMHLNKATVLLEEISNNIKFSGSNSIIMLEQLITIEKELKKLCDNI